MDWFSLWFNGAYMAVQGFLHVCFSGWITGKRPQARHVALYLFLLSAGAFLPSGFLAAGAGLLSLYGVNRLMGNTCPAACVTAILAVYIAWLAGGCVNSLASMAAPYVPAGILWGYVFSWTTLLMSLGLCLGCYLIIPKWFPMQDKGLDPYIWMLLWPGVFLFAVELYIFSSHYGNTTVMPFPKEIGKQFSLLVLQMLGLAALVCTLYAYKHVCDGFRLRSSLASLEQETNAQRTYVEQARMRYGQTRAFRHDIKNHLSVLDGLLKSGQAEGAREYLQKLEAVSMGLSFPIQTGNPVMDVLLGDKLELARVCGAEVDSSLVLPRPCGVSDLDWCVIFANALDNAIQACAGMEGTTSIRMAGEQQGSFYLLEFENTCIPKASPAMGTGLSNIKTVAEKYGGAMTFETSGALFRLHVLLDISVRPDGISGQIP